MTTEVAKLRAANVELRVALMLAERALLDEHPSALGYPTGPGATVTLGTLITRALRPANWPQPGTQARKRRRTRAEIARDALDSPPAGRGAR